MIKSEKEYQKALKGLEEEQKVIERQREHFKKMEHTGEELERLMHPLRSFHSQLQKVVEAYEGMKRGNLGIYPV